MIPTKDLELAHKYIILIYNNNTYYCTMSSVSSKYNDD